MQYWLVKTEPSSFSIDNLKAQGVSTWEGVRGFQARNNMALMRLGDLVLVYHSSIPSPCIVGLATVEKEHFPDPTHFYGGTFWAINVRFLKKFDNPYSLAQIRQNPALQTMQLIKQQRLSVSPVTPGEWEELSKYLPLKL